MSAQCAFTGSEVSPLLRAILSTAQRSVEIQEAQLQLFAQRQQHEGHPRASGAPVAGATASDALITGNVQPPSGESRGRESEKDRPKLAFVESQPPGTGADAEPVISWSDTEGGTDTQATRHHYSVSEMLASQAWEPEVSHRNLCGTRANLGGVPGGPLLPDGVPPIWRRFFFALGVLSPSEVKPGVGRMLYQMHRAFFLVSGIVHASRIPTSPS